MPSFSSRSQQIEIMDDLNCSGEVVEQTLRELETINKFLGGNEVTVNGLKKLIRRRDASYPISVTDLGCGGGHILKLISRWAEQNKLRMDLTGLDANPNIIAFAKKNSVDFPNIKYETVDIFSPEFESRKFDIIIGTLFFHHFSDEQLIAFFTQLKKQAGMGVIINDIHRHWLAYHSIRLLTKMFSKSAMVKFDAPLSVLRAFRRKELAHIFEKAGITNYTIRWMWAFRWQVIIYCEN